MYVNFFNADSSTIKMWKTTHNNRGDELSSSPGQGEHGQAGERQRAKRMNTYGYTPTKISSCCFVGAFKL